MVAIAAREQGLIMDECIAVTFDEEITNGYFAGFRSNVLRARIEWEQISKTMGTVPVVTWWWLCGIAVFRNAHAVTHVEHIPRFTRTTVCRGFRPVKAERWLLFVTPRAHFVAYVYVALRFVFRAMRHFFGLGVAELCLRRAPFVLTPIFPDVNVAFEFVFRAMRHFFGLGVAVLCLRRTPFVLTLFILIHEVDVAFEFVFATMCIFSCLGVAERRPLFTSFARTAAGHLLSWRPISLTA